MIPQLNIIALLNTAAVLSQQKLHDNLFIADTSSGPFRSGQGTDEPCTDVVPGQVLNWHSDPINVQTDVWVSGIRWYKDGEIITNPNDEPVTCSKLFGSPDALYWAAIVSATQPGYYQYQLQFNIVNTLVWMTSFAQIHVSAHQISGIQITGGQ